MSHRNSRLLTPQTSVEELQSSTDTDSDDQTYMLSCKQNPLGHKQADTQTSAQTHTEHTLGRYFTCSFSLFEVRIMEATTSGRVSLGRLSNRRLNLATTGTDMSNIPTNYKQRETGKGTFCYCDGLNEWCLLVIFSHCFNIPKFIQRFIEEGQMQHSHKWWIQTDMFTLHMLSENSSKCMKTTTA